MGSAISYLNGPLPQDEERTIATQSPYYPLEASVEPEDTRSWYCDFWEHAFAVPHKDGKGIIIYEPKDEDTRARPEWAIKRLRKAYELLGEGHPRIVRYVKFEECCVEVNAMIGVPALCTATPATG